jgi:hypothetical protein
LPTTTLPNGTLEGVIAICPFICGRKNIKEMKLRREKDRIRPESLTVHTNFLCAKRVRRGIGGALYFARSLLALELKTIADATFNGLSDLGQITEGHDKRTLTSHRPCLFKLGSIPK